MRFPLSLDMLPDSSHPMLAEVKVGLFDLGGRPVNTVLRLPVRSREAEVGLKPTFSGSLAGKGEAEFEIVAVGRSGASLPGRKIAFDWVREHYDYSWYQEAGEWKVRTIVSDEVLATGEIRLDSQGKAKLSRRLDYGRYRLDLFDEESGSAASRRFHVGWWAASPLADEPDALELSLERDDVEAGETVRAFVRAPFAGRALITVMNDHLLYSHETFLPAEGKTIEFPVSGDWGPGAYVMASAYRPQVGKPSPLPFRALGLAWFAVNKRQREVVVEMNLPDIARPRSRITIPVSVTGDLKKDEPLRLTIAAVDEGILQLTGFPTPRPEVHFLGQKQLGFDLRDQYGHLIRAAEGRRGRVRSGGDRAVADENARGITLRSAKTVALYRRDVLLDGEGKGSFSLDLPDFNGSLRLMAVAYGKKIVGSGEARLLVRDDLIAEILLPRFLAPGDEAEATLSLHNLSGVAKSFEIDLEASGGVTLADSKSHTVDLGPDARFETPVAVRGLSVGAGKLVLRARGTDWDGMMRQWDLQVRPAQPYVTHRQMAYLDPDASLDVAHDGLEGFLEETLAADITVTARPEFNVPALLDSLHRYPYGCTEQTISRALPLLYFPEVSRRWDRDVDDLSIHRRVDRAIRRVLDRQRSDGSLAVWSSYGDRHRWLSAYGFDFLTRAAAAGYDVPSAAYAHLRRWLRGFVSERNGTMLYAKAYAHYVLTRIGTVDAGEVRYFADTYADNIRTRLGIGHLAAALAFVGEHDRAEALFEAAIAKRRPKSDHIRDYGSDLRDGAALSALIGEAFPRSSRLHRLTAVLEDYVYRREYFSTQEQAWLLLSTHAVSSGIDDGLQVSVNDDPAAVRDGPLRLSLSGEDLRLPLRIANDGKGPIRVIRSLRGVPREPLPEVSSGFTLTRTIYRTDGSLADLSAVRQNDEFIVLLEGEAENETEHEALVVDLLPAGFEIENAALGGTAVRERFSFLPELSDFAFEAARDDRYVAAIDLDRWQRRFVAAYVVRAVTPGRFAFPGSFVEDMYKPQYHARGAFTTVAIARQ